MTRWSLTKSILVFGVIYFTAFAGVGVTFRRFDVSDETLSIVGGVMAYVFLMTVAVLAFVRWRRGRRASTPTTGPRRDTTPSR